MKITLSENNIIELTVKQIKFENNEVYLGYLENELIYLKEDSISSWADDYATVTPDFTTSWSPSSSIVVGGTGTVTYNVRSTGVISTITINKPNTNVAYDFSCTISDATANYTIKLGVNTLVSGENIDKDNITITSHSIEENDTNWVITVYATIDGFTYDIYDKYEYEKDIATDIEIEADFKATLTYKCKPELYGTWVLNDTLTQLYDGDINSYDVNFTLSTILPAVGDGVEYLFTLHQIFTDTPLDMSLAGLGFSISEVSPSTDVSDAFKEQGYAYLYDYSDGWKTSIYGEGIKTIHITSKLNEVENGDRLLAWLNINGKKISGAQ